MNLALGVLACCTPGLSFCAQPIKLFTKSSIDGLGGSDGFGGRCVRGGPPHPARIEAWRALISRLRTRAVRSCLPSLDNLRTMYVLACPREVTRSHLGSESHFPRASRGAFGRRPWGRSGASSVSI